VNLNVNRHQKSGLGLLDFFPQPQPGTRITHSIGMKLAESASA